MKKNRKFIAPVIILLCLLCIGCSTQTNISDKNPRQETEAVSRDTEALLQQTEEIETPTQTNETDVVEEPQAQQPVTEVAAASLSEIPEYDGSPYVEIHDNMPDFSREELTTESFETYSDLDPLGRCGVAFANVGMDLMPTEERGEIGQIRPSGWQLAKYDIVDGQFLYNRCHLIAYQLAGENANEKNLITGTRYLNTQGMLPFENRVADYVKDTGNHVLYRVTPLYDGDNLVASGVEMEALSVEDGGEGISFHVFCYNVQPGIRIDYATGDSCLEEINYGEVQEKDTQEKAVGEKSQDETKHTYILNTNTHKFHNPDCRSVSRMADHNKKEYTGSRDELIDQGYEPCQNCNP